MNLYYYCSYSESPVGYILGALAYAEDQTENYQLSAQDIPPLIRSCFESGAVRKAAGKLESGRYFLLIKKLTAKSGEGNAALNYYLNLALETEDFSQYKNWLRESGDSTESLAEAIRATMELDRTSEFGFSVRSAEAAGLVQKSFRSLFPARLGREPIESLYLKLTSSQTDLEKLKEILDLPDMEFKWVAEKWVCTEKKKRFPIVGILLVIVRILLVAAAILVAIFLICWSAN